VATPFKEGLAVGVRSMPGNPQDDHTLAENVKQASILMDRMPKTVIVDRGYQGITVAGFIS
jgi:IS5 family transposase